MRSIIGGRQHRGYQRAKPIRAQRLHHSEGQEIFKSSGRAAASFPNFTVVRQREMPARARWNESHGIKSTGEVLLEVLPERSQPPRWVRKAEETRSMIAKEYLVEAAREEQ